MIVQRMPGLAAVWLTLVATASLSAQQPTLRKDCDWNSTGLISCLAFSPDGKTLASVSGYGGDKDIRLWDVTTGKELPRLKGHTHEVWSVAYSPDGKTLASASRDRTVKLWNMPTGKERATLKGHTDWVTSVAFSPDGKTLASTGTKELKLWDVLTGKE